MKTIDPNWTRRRLLQAMAAFGLVAGAPKLSATTDKSAITKPIPASGEQIPVIGMGTSRTFDTRDAATRARLGEVLQAFFQHGGSVIDSSPMYGAAEEVIGELLKSARPKQLFAATKVWIDGERAGVEQMENSRNLWGVKRFDLMQIHNLRDWQVHLKTLRRMKDDGKIRYIGITTSHGRAHDELEDVLKKERFDFVQFSYNIEDRAVEERLLPLAQDRGIATLINRPFQLGGLFSKVQGKPLPEFAKSIDCQTWAQYFLKFVVSHPAVTCAIPATSKPKHMVDNMAAGFGRLPDAKLRAEMLRYLESV